MGLLGRADSPPLRGYLKAARRWEICLIVSVAALLVAALVVPWAVTGSPVVGLLSLAGFCALWFLLAAPVLIVVAVRHPDGIGTRWDGERWTYR